MSPVEVLFRQYTALTLGTGPATDETAAAERGWLASLTEFLHGYTRRPRFRGHAAGWLRDLAPGGDSAARRHADEVRAAAIGHARLLRDLLRTPKGRALLAYFVSEVTPFGELVRRPQDAVSFTQAVEHIAAGGWPDVVAADDYFQPLPRWPGCGQHHPRALLESPRMAPWLADDTAPLLGDFVARYAGHRAAGWRGQLALLRESLVVRSNYRRVRRPRPVEDPDDRFGFPQYFKTTRQPTTPPMARILSDAGRLDAAVAGLVGACTDAGVTPVRDACAVLTQVYAAVHQAPALDWLGLSDGGLQCGRAVLRCQLESAEHRRTAVQLAAMALSTAEQDAAGGPPGRSAVDEAVAAGGLVVEVAGQRVHWRGERLTVDWGRHRTSWKLLLALARGARLGRPATEVDVFGDAPPSRSAMATAFSRLVQILPSDLWQTIEAVRDPPRSYRLTLQSDCVHVLD